jgi:hypothetical protein
MLGVVIFGDGVAQLSIPDRKWVARAPVIVTALAVDSQGRYRLGYG